MKSVLIWALVISSPTFASMSLTGFAEALYAGRTASSSTCRTTVEACPELANEQRLQLLFEGRAATTGATIRANVWNDASLATSRVELVEGYADIANSSALNARIGRQVITWGTGEYLYVNDVFPKNYDLFFRGHAFDALKESVDAGKFAYSTERWDTELVLSRPKSDALPDGRRYVGTSQLPMSRLSQNRRGLDSAVRMATRLGNVDAGLYVGRYRAREQSIVPSGTTYRREGSYVSHLGGSITGNCTGGVAWVELAYLDTDLRMHNVNRFAYGSRLKGLVGYSREMATDVSFTFQLQTEHDTDHSAYVQSLAPGIKPVAANRALIHMKIQARLRNQTVRLGAQAFVGSEGDYHLNPFVSYAALDALNIEFGANLFRGDSDARYGALRHDSNVYITSRYSF